METTFITIHDLSSDARILYTSDSVIDILGYTPDQVLGRPCWDFFHPEEVPFARRSYGKGVTLDKAAVISYARLKSAEGRWVCCEVVFTIVYDVMVGCVSVYNRGINSQKRAAEAPAIRRLFSSSPKDPRYYMLSHLAPRFSRSVKAEPREPRAALFINRFTRTLTIMHATSATQEILGVSGEELRGQSFYYCIQENCLEDAVRCVENAKANDSIAYLRFWFRDPRTEEEKMDCDASSDGQDEVMDTTETSEEEMSEGGVQLRSTSDTPQRETTNLQSPRMQQLLSPQGNVDTDDSLSGGNSSNSDSRASSGDSHQLDTHEDIFGHSDPAQSSTSSLPMSPKHEQRSPEVRRPTASNPIEVEAVISCTSDGLVICLRRARPVKPYQPRAAPPPQQIFANGMYATPWATEPIIPPLVQRLEFNDSRGFRPSLGPAQPIKSAQRAGNGPREDDFMKAIRDLAVFAWALTGLNGSLAEYAQGVPRGESQPIGGPAAWKPEMQGQPAFHINTDHHPVTSTASYSHNANGINSRYNSNPSFDDGAAHKIQDQGADPGCYSFNAANQSNADAFADGTQLNGNGPFYLRARAGARFQ